MDKGCALDVKSLGDYWVDVQADVYRMVEKWRLLHIRFGAMCNRTRHRCKITGAFARGIHIKIGHSERESGAFARIHILYYLRLLVNFII